MNKDITFRYAQKEDAALILKFIKGLAKYEKMENDVVATERGCGRLEWCCLDWNKPSIDFICH